MNIMKMLLTLFALFLGTISHAFDAQEFYKNRCISCHDLGSKDGLGPALEGVGERRDKEWIAAFIQDSQSVIKSGDPQAVKLYEKWNKKAMPSFNLSDEEAGLLAEFISNPGDAAKEMMASSSKKDPNLKVIQNTSEMQSETLLYAILGSAFFLIFAFIALKSGNKKIFSSFFIIVALVLLGVAGYQAYKFARATDYTVGYAPIQPIKFSHKTHAGDNGMSCVYCHYGADKGKHAAIPPVDLCMNCHNHVQKDSFEVKKIYQALKDKKHIEWEKVHYLPDFAAFNHSVHVNSGKVSCQDCHGEVQNMEILEQKKSMSMGFCLDCHRGHDESFLPDNDSGQEPGVLFDCASCHY